MAFVILTVIASVSQLSDPISATAQSRIAILMQPSWDVAAWLGNLWGMITFDYPFLQGEYSLLRWILFLPIGIGFSAMLILTIAQLIATAMSGLGRLR
jgi:hypothetical protein